MKPYYADEAVTLYHGNCIEVMRHLPDASVDAVVTDPPYGLEFMGKEWDSFAPVNMIKRSGWDTAASSARIDVEDGSPHGRVTFHKRRSTYKCRACGKRDAFRNSHPCGDRWDAEWVDEQPVEAMAFGEWCRLWATEAIRVLKPGGHLLAFGGTRTWHRLAVAIEDAGFEVRDCIAWMYGSGFPKSLDVSKAIDKAAGAEREVVGMRSHAPVAHGAAPDAGGSHIWTGRLTSKEGLTAAAQQWQGWGTALKPAFEPIVVARKPLIGTVAENVLTHGTGALNVDGCRIAAADEIKQMSGKAILDGSSDGWDRPWKSDPEALAARQQRANEAIDKANTLGRWPANVILDESQAEALDRQSGTTAAGNYPAIRNGIGYKGAGSGTEGERTTTGDTGGASRFFYTAKASSAERPRVDGVAHPTVKPLDLMQYLVRLVTPPRGIVLEPFAGSGTTLEACIAEGFQCIGIELTDEYLPLIMQRITKPIEVTLL